LAVSVGGIFFNEEDCMTDLFKEPTGDPTLEAAMKALEAKEGGRGHSRRVGGSSVGHECLRRGWYSFRWTSPSVMTSTGLLAINDGHRGEIVLADLLKAVPGIELWTETEKPGEQINFELVEGHFVGKLDGVILGLLQAPKTAHVWEAKVVNIKKVEKLKKDVIKFGEKHALEQWDAVYFAQAQMYMHGMGLTRHYLTVASPGVREIISVRTDYQPKMAQVFEGRAKSIVYGTRAPSRISNDPAFFGCKFCDHGETCHGQRIPDVSCRTCAHSTPKPGGYWVCELHGVETDYETQQAACRKHRFHPDLVPGDFLKTDLDENSKEVLLYQVGGNVFIDGDKMDRLEDPRVPF
jgi:hypothetical protein